MIDQNVQNAAHRVANRVRSLIAIARHAPPGSEVPITNVDDLVHSLAFHLPGLGWQVVWIDSVQLMSDEEFKLFLETGEAEGKPQPSNEVPDHILAAVGAAQMAKAFNRGNLGSESRRALAVLENDGTVEEAIKAAMTEPVHPYDNF